jgi:polyphosphate kinase
VFEFRDKIIRPLLITSGNTLLVNRDLSWFQFNERVLEEAMSDNPLLEKLKFLGITSSNLDEFFMIRVSSIERGLKAKRQSLAIREYQSLKHIKSKLFKSAKLFSHRQQRVLLTVQPELEKIGIYLVLGSLPKETLVLFEDIYKTQIAPHLQAETFIREDFNTIENLKTVALLDENTWVKIPRSLPGLYTVEISGKFYIAFLDGLVKEFYSASGKKVQNFIRVTRDGDYVLDLGDKDLEFIPKEVQSRIVKRELGAPIRLQYTGLLSARLQHECRRGLNLSRENWIDAPGTLYLHSLKSILSYVPAEFLAKPNATYTKIKEKMPIPVKDSKIFDKIKVQDYLLHHPYDSFDTYVHWIKTACEDPLVESIEQTVYRIDTLSPVIEALKKAAKKKRVRVFIELRARFDEQNNLKLAKELKEAGAQVTYGFGALKLHAKVALVTRLEEGKKVYYTHLSTGNYHAITARQYTDLALLTAHPGIGSDARYFFDSLYEKKMPQNLNFLVLAPKNLAKRLLALIEQEKIAALEGRKAQIIAKMNALVDPQIIKALYSASNAGVQIDLIVRGACSLVPNVPGLSENIRVVSIVDRFLEHSRIYYFENSRQIYLSSADWMPRNFHSRVEIAFPVLDTRIFSYLTNVVLPTYLQDTVKARELTKEGVWKRRVNPLKVLQAQKVFADA